MDMTTTDSVRDELIKENPSFRDLVQKHQNYEKRLTELAQLTYPIDDSFIDNAQNMKKILLRHLNELNNLEPDKRVKIRFQKFRKMGNWIS